MGKRLHMAASGEYILWATIPESANSTFNRAYGPFVSRSAAYSVRLALINNKRSQMLEEGYTPDEVEETIKGIQWTTTGLWRKVEDDRLIDPVIVAVDTPEERAAEAIWNRSSPVRKGARPKWDEVRNSAEWRRGVKAAREDAKVALAVLQETSPTKESPEDPSV